MQGKYRKILIIKLCCIGDVIFITPAIRALRKAFPDAHIGFLASKWIREIVERMPSIDEIIYYDSPVSAKGIFETAGETAGVIKNLRSKKYEMAILGHRNSKFALVALLAGIKARIGFTGTKFLTKSAPFDENKPEIERYLSIIRLLGIDANDTITTLTAKPEDFTEAENLCRKLEMDEKRKYIGIFPGGGENPGTVMPIKRWYPEKYAELCVRISKELNLFPLFLGSRGDSPVIGNILSILPKDFYSINAGGMTDLGALCGLIKKCKFVIGGDTGPLHMAAALGIPTLMLFGPSDPRLVAPQNKNCRYIWNQVYCSPCYTPISVMKKTGKEFICRTGTHECLRDLNAEDVMKIMSEMAKDIPLD